MGRMAAYHLCITVRSLDALSLSCDTRVIRAQNVHTRGTHRSVCVCVCVSTDCMRSALLVRVSTVLPVRLRVAYPIEASLCKGKVLFLVVKNLAISQSIGRWPTYPKTLKDEGLRAANKL